TTAAGLHHSHSHSSLDLIQSVEDDPLLDPQPLPRHSLQAHFRPRFHPLPTVIIASLLLLIHVSCLGEGDPSRGDVFKRCISSSEGSWALSVNTENIHAFLLIFLLHRIYCRHMCTQVRLFMIAMLSVI
uniref:Uncharacterized protein n=1 Tax=Catagonus wagneri TaxID=51154 RepID=A0A8C3W5P1_9CETA